MPLDDSHRDALDVLVRGIAAAAGVHASPASPAHITLAAFRGVARETLASALTAALRWTGPFTVHAHGFGLFAGRDPGQLSLHVDVVRSPDLERVHELVLHELLVLGADVAPWSEADAWSPHITLLDRGLDPSGVGVAAAWLAQRHHPSWQIPVRRLLVTGGRGDCDRPAIAVRFGTGAAIELDDTFAKNASRGTNGPPGRADWP
jgi:2'-5' RNA ligase